LPIKENNNKKRRIKMANPKECPALWAKLIDLPLDHLEGEARPAFGFISRLRSERGWDYGKTVRVVAEYRRFLYLAALGPVCPSDDVDAAWHLHLTYTRAYWAGLCEATLGRPLDHTPSGSGGDTERFKSLYEDTLNRYRKSFGEEPPRDLWPPVTKRFAPVPTRAPLKAPSWIAPLGIVLVAAWFIGLHRVIGGIGLIMLLGMLFIGSASAAHRKHKNDHGLDLSFDVGGWGDTGGDAGGDGGGCGGGGCG